MGGYCCTEYSVLPKNREEDPEVEQGLIKRINSSGKLKRMPTPPRKSSSAADEPGPDVPVQIIDDEGPPELPALKIGSSSSTTGGRPSLTKTKSILKTSESKEHSKSAQKILLKWCRRCTQGYEGIDPPGLRNFTTDWKSGLAFAALVHRFRPDLLDYEAVKAKYGSRELLQHVFDLADTALDVAILISPTDLEPEKPDGKIIFTQVSEFYKAFKVMDIALPMDTDAPSPQPSPRSGGKSDMASSPPAFDSRKKFSGDKLSEPKKRSSPRAL